MDHGRELKKAQGLSVPTLSETDRKTILDHWKTEKWAKLQILWNILLKQHSCPESGCLKPQLDNAFSRTNYYQAKDSEELENIFKIRQKINETNKNQPEVSIIDPWFYNLLDYHEALTLSLLENSIFNLFLRIIEQEKEYKSGLVYFEENSDESVSENMDHVMKKIEYEIRCIKYFGSFLGKSIWVLFHEYFPEKVSDMIPSNWIKMRVYDMAGIFHSVIKATNFWEMFTELYYNHDRNNDADSEMISKILKQKDGQGNTVLHLLSMVSS